MGRIGAPFGVHGWVRVTPWSEDAGALVAHRTWAMRETAVDEWRDVEVLEAKQQTPGIVARFAGVESREAAAALRGREVGLRRDALPPPAENEYFWTDLEGLEVMNRSGVSLGRVAGVAGNGAHPILRVAAEEGAERLIPFVPAYVDRVDMTAGRIEVDWQADY